MLLFHEIFYMTSVVHTWCLYVDTACSMPAHTYKNRYADVLCYDETRVVLSPINDDPTTDYINASYVNGYKQKFGYIACQGPLSKTNNDFWRMVWQEDCRVIVMTTRQV